MHYDYQYNALCISNYLINHDNALYISNYLYNWYNWNIVERGVKHLKLNQHLDKHVNHYTTDADSNKQ